MLRRALLALAVLGVLAAGCSADGGADDAEPLRSTTSAMASPSTTTTLVPGDDATTTTAATATTLLDPELGCLRAALSDRPELLAALDAADPKAPDLIRALVVARDCLSEAQLGAALVEGLRASLTEDISDFQAECLADQLLALPNDQLELLLVDGAATPDAKRLATRVLSLCQVEG